MNPLIAKAQLILEYLKATSYAKDSGLFTEEVQERRERLSKEFEEILASIS